MNSVLEAKGKFMKIYRDFEVYFKVIARFIFAFLTLASITNGLGYYEVLNLTSIRLFIAVVCAFIPAPMVVLIMIAVILLHLFKLSVVFAALALVVFMIMYLLYLKFAPAQGMYMLAVVALAPFHLEFAVPLILGAFATPMSLVPVAIGIFTVRFLRYISEAAALLGTSAEIDKIVTSIQSVVDKLMADKEMVLFMIVFSAVIVLVYIVKRLPFDYSWYAAIAAGAILNIVLLLVGGGMLHVSVGLGGVFIGTVVGAVAAVVVQFLDCTVDYHSKQFLEFEDDDYFYYVKALPKVGEAPANQPKHKEADREKNHSLKNKKRTKTVEEVEVEDEEQWITEISNAMSKKEELSRNLDSQDDFGGFDDYNFDDFDDGESKF